MGRRCRQRPACSGDATRGVEAAMDGGGDARVRIISSERNGPGELVAIEKDGRAEQDDLGSKNDLLASSGALKEEGLL